MSENLKLQSLTMLVENEKSSFANASIYLDFYASKEAQGIELDLQERSDRDFWAQNLIKINERLAYFEQELAIEIASQSNDGHVH